MLTETKDCKVSCVSDQIKPKLLAMANFFDEERIAKTIIIFNTGLKLILAVNRIK